jgi:hypothetical protein
METPRDHARRRMELVNTPDTRIKNVPARREGTDRRVGTALARRSPPQNAWAVPRGGYGINAPIFGINAAVGEGK